MASAQSAGPLHKHACNLCARRKVKCDRANQCANCTRAKVACLYEAPVVHRRRKHPAESDLAARLARCEELLRKHNVDFEHGESGDGDAEHVWIASGFEAKASPDTGAASSMDLTPASESLQR